MAETKQKALAESKLKSEAAAAVFAGARAEEAQRQNDEEMTEAGILTASEERAEDSEDADDESESDSASESESESSSDAELACLSEVESEQDENRLPTPPPTPTLLTLRHNQPLHYHIPTVGPSPVPRILLPNPAVSTMG